MSVFETGLKKDVRPFALFAIAAAILTAATAFTYLAAEKNAGPEQSPPAAVRRALEATALREIRRLRREEFPSVVDERSKVEMRETRKAKERRFEEKTLAARPSRRGMFVSIFEERSRRLVGCMGALYPHRANLLAEVLHWSRAAYLFDPRRTTKRGRLRRVRFAVIISFIEGVEPVAHYLRIDSIREGMLARLGGREELVLPGEAYTAAYARKMLLRKLGLRAAPRNGLEIFRVRAVRFGGAKRLFKRSAPGFKGYGG